MSEIPTPMAGVTPPAIDRFLVLLSESLADATFVRLVLSSPTPEASPLTRIDARLIQLRDQPSLSLTQREKGRDTTRNLTLPEATPWLATQLGSQFTAALLETTRKDWQLALRPGQPPRLVPHAPKHRTAPDRSHDRPRIGPFEPSAQDWLQALGLVDPKGKPFPSRADKYRQVLRYAEILGHLLRDAAFPAGTAVQVADMGCGRGYLTFAAWQLLHRQGAHPGSIVGVETRTDLAQETQAIADRLGHTGIRFQAGTIASTDPGPLDILIALHACNTATDDAIRRGIQAGARLILVAPCCHQELRPQLGKPELFAPLLAHGILAERFSEWLTDGLRALALEAAGYRTKLIEFVGSEHTPKNLLLAGIRCSEGPDAPARARARDQITALKEYFGLSHLTLESVSGS